MSEPEVGILEWFWIKDRDHAERVIARLRALNVRHLRFGFSWADYQRPDGQAWYDWLVPRLAEVCELLPCFLYTPPSLGEQSSTASPARNLKDYADFLDHCIDRYGEHFDTVELWSEPNNFREWDATLDGDWRKFAAWRPGDQRYYCSDIRRFREATGWQPRVLAREGIARLHAWLAADSYVIAAAPPACAAAAG